MHKKSVFRSKNLHATGLDEIESHVTSRLSFPLHTADAPASGPSVKGNRGVQLLIDRATWAAALGTLEVQMNSGQFAAWLKDSHFLEGGDGRLVIGVPNAFARETIERNYKPLVDDAVRKIAGRAVAITFVIDSRPTSKQVPAGVSKGSNRQRRQDTPPEPIDRLLDRFSFENYVVGRSNQLAHAAARRVSEKPGKTYNPLFIYGGVGLGKTHLLRAIATSVLKLLPTASILYATSETFTNDLVGAIRTGRTVQLRSKYRDIDVLLLDDVQFLAGRESTQEELFHTFDSLHAQGKQIVFTSDRPPHEIEPLSDRLVTRFACGLVADVQPPDIETRIAVLQTRAEVNGMLLPTAVAEYMAAKITTNIRDLEGALTRVLAFSNLEDRVLDVGTAKLALRGLAYGGKRQVLVLDDVLKAVADHFRLDTSAIVGPSRQRDLSHPRQIAMYLMRAMTSYSLPAIGAYLGNRDHSTVLHGYRKVASKLKSDSSLTDEIEFIQASILGS